MKRYLSALLVLMACVCCWALVACGGSETASTGSSSSDTSTASQTADSASKFIGTWKMAATETGGITVVDGESDEDIPLVVIEADGTAKYGAADNTLELVWVQKDDNTLSLTPKDEVGNGTAATMHEIVYQDDTLLLSLENESGQQGTIIFTKDGALADYPPLSLDNATNITSKDALVGTWTMSGVLIEGSTMYGDAESLAKVNGGIATTATFNEDGTAEILETAAEWSVGDQGAVATVEGDDIAVLALGDDILIDIGTPYDMNMHIKFSK